MSEPVSNREIEDVLSSIRRLISANADERGGAVASVSDRAPGKLLLTPDQLVDVPGNKEGVDSTIGQPMSATAAEIASPDTAAPREPAVNLGETLVLHEDARLDIAAESEHLALEETLAELEAAVDQGASDWEPDGTDDCDDADRALQENEGAAVLQFRSLHWQEEMPEAEIVAEVEVPAPADDETSLKTSEIAEAEKLSQQDVVDLSEKVKTNLAETYSEVEAPVCGAEREDVWSDEAHVRSDAPEMPDDCAPVETMPEWEIEPTAEAGGEAEPETVFVAADLEDAAPEDVDFIDEDALRDLVSRMLREELQGVVGQRMTQSIRRLVRREIARALTVQDDL